MAAYFIDTGLLLVVAPWTPWWQRNFFVEILPWLDAFRDTLACRVWVMVTGALTACAGMADVYALVRNGGAADTASPSRGTFRS